MPAAKRFRVVFLTAVLAAAVLLSSCSRAPKKTFPEPPPRKKETPMQAGRPGDVKVLMMGRSVMEGWFRHWTGDSGKPARKGKYVLYPTPIETPPQIAASVEKKLAEADVDKNTVVFFKFCFDDFAGSSRGEASQSLAEKKKYVQRVYESVASKRGLTLIVGNALPKTKKFTDRWLVWNEREFNKWLEEFAAQHDEEVIVFDEYGVLADANGNLRAEYASNPEDSHPNERGYKALDGPFVELLERL